MACLYRQEEIHNFKQKKQKTNKITFSKVLHSPNISVSNVLRGFLCEPACIHAYTLCVVATYIENKEVYFS